MMRFVVTKRRRNRKPDTYGDYHRYVSKLPCVACSHPVRGVGHHVKSIASGGVDHANEVCLCRLHHHEIHTIGRQTFAAKYGLDLQSIAERIARDWNG